MAWTITWTEGPVFPDLIKGGAMGVVGGCIVHAAGITFPWRERETGWWLDPSEGLALSEAEGTWHPLPPMPEGRAYTQGVTAQDALFVVGGRKSGQVCTSCFRLRRVEGLWRWDVLPDLRWARGVPALAAVGARIYAIGGGSWTTGAFLPEDTPLDEVLDLADLDQGWRDIPPCPGRRRAGACAASVGGKVYVFGGAYSWMEGVQRRTLRLGDAWCFDPDEGTWDERAPLPVIGLSGAAALPVADRFILLIGGGVAKEAGRQDCVMTYEEDVRRGVRVGWYNDRVFVYDATTDTYTEVSGRLPYPTHDIRAERVGDTIYAVGGENDDRSVSNTCAHVRVGKIVKGIG